MLYRFFRTPAYAISQERQIAADAARRLGVSFEALSTEWCYYAAARNPLSERDAQILRWLLAETFEPRNFAEQSFLGTSRTRLEVGPRLNFETAWSSTAVSVLRACGISGVTRLERSVRFGLNCQLSDAQAAAFLAPLHDRMTQTRYETPLKSLAATGRPRPVRTVDILSRGPAILEDFSKTHGCGWDDYDTDWICDLFRSHLKRNPTDAELFQIAQSITAEHSRHGFFKGRHFVGGEEVTESLLDTIKRPWRQNPANSAIAFDDDSSASRGGWINLLIPATPGKPGPALCVRRFYDHTATAETHNHPTFIEPFEGFATGTGGRLRDQHAVGRGGLIGVGALGIMTGNLCVPRHRIPGENETGYVIPPEFAPPLQVLLRGIRGAYDYGNCFGEPTVLGATRTFGLNIDGQRRGWYKPVAYTAGFGLMDRNHRKKGKPLRDMLIVQVGGKAYRIGVGGGSGSSQAAGEISAQLAFNSVQRGGPEMENRVNRVIAACVAMGPKNPIVAVHDYGAGGACNCLTELVVPAGARLNLRALPVGDETLSVMEIWANESQERDGFLIRPKDWESFKSICERERAESVIVGRITGDGWLVLHDESDGTTPVKLPLDRLLAKLPRREFHHTASPLTLKPLCLPKNLTVEKALRRVLLLPQVGSKRFLTSTVDCSVGGLTAQSQRVGPNQLPLSDFAVMADSMLSNSEGLYSGLAMSLGEQPIKGLVDPEKMARLALAESLTNLVGAHIPSLECVKYEANWMWAAKKPGEGPRLIAAAEALVAYMTALGVAIDGGKDSLSMSASIEGPAGTIDVKAPGQLILAAYAPMADVTRKVTSDLKRAGSVIFFLDLSDGSGALGASSLAQCFGQVGNDCPDACPAETLKATFSAVQELVALKLITAVHDRSDGGLIVTLLEMAFAGNLGLSVNVRGTTDAVRALFSEGPGLVLECADAGAAFAVLRRHGTSFQNLGITTRALNGVAIAYNGELALYESLGELRALWEKTSTKLDRLQANPFCVQQEARVNSNLLSPPPYRATLKPVYMPERVFRKTARPDVAVIREQGTNGDREMHAALRLAGFRTWDITMSDLVEGRAKLDERFRGVIFPGGFSFGDVLDSGKGWAAVIRFNGALREQFERFRARPDAFSLGVCNGCQLMALLAWVPGLEATEEQQPRFIRNRSGRFESRWVTVKVLDSPAIMLSGMTGSTLGVWVAHGEGRLRVPEESVLKKILRQNLAPIRYVDRDCCPTAVYPFNPNGSPFGIASLCSPNGRHLAMMPHPERSVLNWQWAWLPEGTDLAAPSPWLAMFQNACRWCTENR